MKKEPLVSIIIPVYNRENLVGETLDSVIAQTYRNWECIVVDDGSTDRTREVVQTYCDKDPRIKLFSRPDDRPKGANACRNYGFELSRGEFIKWFDSDDLMHPTLVEAQVSTLQDKLVDCVLCNWQWFASENGKNAIPFPMPITKEPKNLVESYVCGDFFFPTGVALWRRSYLSVPDIRFREDLTRGQEALFHFHHVMNIFSYKWLEIDGISIRRGHQSIASQYGKDMRSEESLLEYWIEVFCSIAATGKLNHLLSEISAKAVAAFIRFRKKAGLSNESGQAVLRLGAVFVRSSLFPSEKMRLVSKLVVGFFSPSLLKSLANINWH